MGASSYILARALWSRVRPPRAVVRAGTLGAEHPARGPHASRRRCGQLRRRDEGRSTSADMSSGLATKASGCKSILLEPFCLFTKSHLRLRHAHARSRRARARCRAHQGLLLPARLPRDRGRHARHAREESHESRARDLPRSRRESRCIVKSLAVQQPDSVLSKRSAEAGGARATGEAAQPHRPRHDAHAPARMRSGTRDTRTR